MCDCQILCARQLDAASAAASAAAAAQGGATAESSRGGGPSAGRLPGLGKALADCPGLDGKGDALASLKRAAHALFVPEQGGSYDVWRQRPLPVALVEYAAADVAYLHTMREAWGSLVSDDEMRQITTTRIGRAISGASAAKGEFMRERDF